MPSSMSPPVFQGSPRGTFYRDANYFSFLIYAEISVFEKAYYEATLKIHFLVRPAALILHARKYPPKGIKHIIWGDALPPFPTYWGTELFLSGTSTMAPNTYIPRKSLSLDKFWDTQENHLLTE